MTKVIVNSNARFLQLPQKRSRWNQLIRRRFAKRKSYSKEIKINGVKQTGQANSQTAMLDGAWSRDEEGGVRKRPRGAPSHTTG